MKTLEVFIEPPIIRNGVETIYLGIYDRIFHHLSQSEYMSSYASLLTDLLNEINPQLSDVIVGRLDADNNRKLLEELDNDNIYNLQIIEPGNYNKVSLWRRVFQSIMADPRQPWVFFQVRTQSYLKQILEQYWFCYAGSWVFLVYNQGFPINKWKQIKETMNYIITEVVERLSSDYRCSIVITDDYEIHFCFPSAYFEEIYHSLETTFLRHGFQAVKRKYEGKGGKARKTVPGLI